MIGNFPFEGGDREPKIFRKKKGEGNCGKDKLGGR